MGLKKSLRSKAKRAERKRNKRLTRHFVFKPTASTEDPDLPRGLPEGATELWDVYHPPFKLSELVPTYIFDAANNMAFDFWTGTFDGLLQVRGWGRLQYLDRGAERQDAIWAKARAILGNLVDYPLHATEYRQFVVDQLNANWDRSYAVGQAFAKALLEGPSTPA